MAVTIKTPVVVNALAVDPIDVIRLTDSLGMVCLEASGTLRAATVTIADPLVPNAELSIDPSSANDEARLVALTATTAMLIYDTGATTTEARILSVSGTTITKHASTVLTTTPGNSSSKFACKISSTKVLFVYTDTSGATKTQGVILSVAGTVVTENAISTIVTASTTGNKCYAFSDTRAIVTWVDVGTGPDAEGAILTLSGNTIFAVGAKKNISTNITSNDDHVYMIGLSATKAIWGGIETIVPRIENFVLTLNGTTFDIGTELDIALTDQNNVNAGKLSSSALVIVGEDPNNTFYAKRYNVTGASSDVLTANGSDTLGITGLSTIRASEGQQSVSILAYEWNTTNDGVILIEAGIAPDEYTLAAMRKPADLAEDGGTIYISALNASGTPVLIQFSTLLNADGSIVFDPGAGDNIGVECGRFNADVVWVAGNFDGTNVIEKSEDGGTTFVVKDDATIGDVRAFVMGPDSDDRLLIFDETNGDILETINSGDSWNSINAAVTPEVNAIARLGENVQETVFGNDGAANNSINYSVNSGDDLEDYQTGVYPNANATGVIAN